MIGPFARHLAAAAAKNASAGGGGDDDGCGGQSSNFKYGWIVAVALCVLSAVIINFGTNLQKLAWNQRQSKPFAAGAVADDPEDLPLTTTDDLNQDGQDEYFDEDDDDEVDPAVEAKFRRSWALGFVAIVIGSLFDFAALGFGAQSVIAPLGSLTLVANMFFAQYMHGEKLSQHDVMATAVIFAGCVLSVAFASHKNEICDVDTLLGLYATLRFVVYAVSILTLILGGFFFVQYIENIVSKYGTRSKQYKQLFRFHRFSYAFLAGVAGAQSVLFAKSLDELLVASFSGHSRIFLAHIGSYLVFLGMLASVTMQVYWLNCALARFDALYVVPVFQAQWIVFGVIGGGVFYGEFSGFSFGQALAFLSGVGLTVLGVYILSQRGYVAPTEMEGADIATDNLDASQDEGGSLHYLASASSAASPHFDPGRSAASIDPMSTPLLEGSPRIKSYTSNDDTDPSEYEVDFEKRRIPLTLEPCTIALHPSGRQRKRPIHLWRVVASRVSDPHTLIKPGHTMIAVDGSPVVGPRVSLKKVLEYVLDGPRPVKIRFRTVPSAKPPFLPRNDDDAQAFFHEDRLGPSSFAGDDGDNDEEEEEEEEAHVVPVSGGRDSRGGRVPPTADDDEIAAYSEGELALEDLERQRPFETSSVGNATPQSTPGRRRMARKRSDVIRSSLRSGSLQGRGMSPFYGMIQSWQDRRSTTNASTPSPAPSASGAVALDAAPQGRNRRRTGSAPPVISSDDQAYFHAGKRFDEESTSSAARPF
ncbi:Magnesium transporter NIPA2 [Hondaea fermentalgiana]|uniref:Magnesium transporter NIPA2 n=1 Tax=Hondaea fermentalgiana TaxID=2315210 RepID=A0A2R5GEA0_9STRA|nr:Magnesium transporter NIPA2 [Hondaea fermentalgiana]|eukprot:GBG28659.1 Magnesium transporter NIPA2 [Hondaea fermentalgiana]